MMKVRDRLLQTITGYGYATVADLRAIKGDDSVAVSDFKTGWTAEEVMDIKYTGNSSSYILILPDPVKIENCDDIKEETNGVADFLSPIIEAFNGFAKRMAANKTKKGEANEQNGQLS